MEFTASDLEENLTSITAANLYKYAIETEENDMQNHWVTLLMTSDGTSVLSDSYPNDLNPLPAAPYSRLTS